MNWTNSALVRIDDPLALLQAAGSPQGLLELAALATCLVLAFAIVWLLRRAFAEPGEDSVLFGRRVIDGVLFPLLLLALAWLARAVLVREQTLSLMPVAIAVLLALAVIRMGVRIVAVAFAQTRFTRALEQTISWVAWGAMVLWVTGILPLALNELDQVSWKLGGSAITVRTLLEGALSAGLVLLLALWVSAAIERRLLRAAAGDELSLRKAVANAVRALLVFIGLMLGLSAVGIDLTALSVLGGAVGVGIGFGLQKLAANYVSGFVILAERSLRIGDNVRVDTFEGRVTDIRARFTVVRSLTGRESIVPNEMLITSRVENLSLADPRVWQSTVVTVAYDSDIERVRALLLEAAQSQPRVLADPGPSVSLSAFGADGLEFTLGYWIADPENGQLNLRSAINLAILQAFRREGVEIPYPQRVLHVRQRAGAELPLAAPPVAPAPASGGG